LYNAAPWVWKRWGAPAFCFFRVLGEPDQPAAATSIAEAIDVPPAGIPPANPILTSWVYLAIFTPKKMLTKAQRLAHVEAWRHSGLSRPAYCREHGLNYSTFMSWFRLETVAEEAPGRFIALCEGEDRTGEVEIVLPNGIRIFYSGELSEALLQRLQDA